MLMLSFLQIPEGVERGWTSINLTFFFGRVINSNENTDSLNGASFVDPKINGVEVLDLENKRLLN